jgi:hypothetical protein
MTGQSLRAILGANQRTCGAKSRCIRVATPPVQMHLRSTVFFFCFADSETFADHAVSRPQQE